MYYRTVCILIYALCGGRSVELKISDIYNSRLKRLVKRTFNWECSESAIHSVSLQEHKHTITNWELHTRYSYNLRSLMCLTRGKICSRKHTGTMTTEKEKCGIHDPEILAIVSNRITEMQMNQWPRVNFTQRRRVIRAWGLKPPFPNKNTIEPSLLNL